MPVSASLLKTKLDANLFHQESNSVWNKCVSNAVIDKIKDPAVYTVMVKGMGNGGSGGVGTIVGIQGISQSIFYGFLYKNWKLYSQLPGSQYSDIIGLKGISMIGDELSLMTITSQPYSSLNGGTCTVTGIVIQEDLIKLEIIKNLKTADMNPLTRMYIARNSEGVVTGEVLDIQKRMAMIIARSIKENLAIITGTGSISGPNTGSYGTESKPGVIS